MTEQPQRVAPRPDLCRLCRAEGPCAVCKTDPCKYCCGQKFVPPPADKKLDEQEKTNGEG